MLLVRTEDPFKIGNLGRQSSNTDGQLPSHPPKKLLHTKRSGNISRTGSLPPSSANMKSTLVSSHLPSTPLVHRPGSFSTRSLFPPSIHRPTTYGSARLSAGERRTLPHLMHRRPTPVTSCPLSHLSSTRLSSGSSRTLAPTLLPQLVTCHTVPGRAVRDCPSSARTVVLSSSSRKPLYYSPSLQSTPVPPLPRYSKPPLSSVLPSKPFLELLSDDDEEIPPRQTRSSRCFVPCRPLIHNRQRAQPSAHDFIYKREGRTQAPTWQSSPTNPLSIRQSVLISYHTRPREIQETRTKKKKVTSCDRLLNSKPTVETSKTEEPMANAKETTPPPLASIPVAKNPPVEESHRSSKCPDAEKDCGSSSTVAPSGVCTESPGVASGIAVLPVVQVESVSQKDNDSENTAAAEGMKAATTHDQPRSCTKTSTTDSSVQDTSSAAASEPSHEKAIMSGTTTTESRLVPPMEDEDSQSPLLSTSVSIVIEAPVDTYVPPPDPPISHGVENTPDAENKVQSILDHVKNRRIEFAKLLEEHAEIVSEINKFENGVTS